jgi:hypothetical protein
MPDETEPAGAEAVIDFAARTIHAAISTEFGLTPGGEPAVVDVAAARALAHRGMLVPVELWDDRAREATPLLRHAAALAKRSGKLRTAEWLTACATLPPGEWPPAPAYKGPMVPAAEHERLTGVVAEAVRLLREAGVIEGEGLAARVRNLVAERDQLRQDLADAERFMERDRQQAIRATTERDQLQARIDKALAELLRGGQDAGDVRRAAIAVLQGDQPDEPDARTGRSGPTPQGFPAETRSTVDSGEAVAKSDGPVCTCAGQCDYDDHDNPLTGDECLACAQLTDTSTCPAYEGDYVPGPPAPFVPAADALPEEP